MEMYRIDITSWTSSFRYPNLISGFQPTLEVPPISTVLGMLNAAAGMYLNHSEINIGYYFQYESKTIDLETIYQIENNGGHPSNNAKSNIMKREFLFNNSLSIYLENEELVSYFRKPVYQMLLGRSNDLATIKTIKKVNLLKTENANRIKGQIIPFSVAHLSGQIQALPKYFTDSIPRRNLGTEPYSIISCNAIDMKTNLTCYHDPELQKNGIDIYFHKISF